MSLIVTDLWLVNRANGTSDAVAMANQIDPILERGDSIAIYGFESPFKGRITDLPSNRHDVTARRHYLYVIAVGPAARLLALRSAMNGAASPAIRGKGHYSLFTLDPAVGLAPDREPLSVPPQGPLTVKPYPETHNGVRLQNVVLDKSAGLRAGLQKLTASAPWKGPPANAVAEGTVWTGPVRGVTTLFRQGDKNCTPLSWRPMGESSDGWDGAAAGFALDPSATAMRLPPGTYMLVGEMRRTALNSPNPATQWMRDWSFDTASEAEAVARPAMPTLNLADTARLLETALDRAAQRHPAVTGGFAVALQVK